MNGERNCGRHPPMQQGERIKGLDRLLVTQNDGDLSPLRAVGRLAFRRWLGHSLPRHEEGAELFSRDERADEFAMLGNEVVPVVAVLAQQLACRAERDGIALAEVIQRNVRVGKQHGRSPVCGSDNTAVTSYMSTPRNELAPDT